MLDGVFRRDARRWGRGSHPMCHRGPSRPRWRRAGPAPGSTEEVVGAGGAVFDAMDSPGVQALRPGVQASRHAGGSVRGSAHPGVHRPIRRGVECRSARGCGRCGAAQAGSRGRRRHATQLDAGSAIAPGAKWPISGGAGRGRPAPARCTMAPPPLTRRRPHHGPRPTFRSLAAIRHRGRPPWACGRRVAGWRVRRVGCRDGGRGVGLAGRSGRGDHFDVDELARGRGSSPASPGVFRRGDGAGAGLGGRCGARGPRGR